MIISLKEIALLTESEIFGDEGLFINKPARIEEAETGDLTFLYLSQYAKYLESTKAAAIFVKPGFQKTRKDITYLEVKDPNKAFAKVVFPEPVPPAIKIFLCSLIARRKKAASFFCNPPVAM